LPAFADFSISMTLEMTLDEMGSKSLLNWPPRHTAAGFPQSEAW
jgi:hypothetical protein